ncbi:MAG: hypothetical protein JNL34_17775 [Anaerolineae bacterium]|nr:hypothetical protein [Anaerolineae bacterium]
MLLVACSTQSVPPTPTPPQLTAPPETTWLEGEAAGVEFGMWKPPGWDADTRGGLVLAEQTTETSAAAGSAIRGAVVNFFCPNLDIFARHAEAPNRAMDIMSQAIALPHVRSVAMGISEPVAFDWHGHDAAYYLLSGNGGIRTLVIGVYLPKRDALLAANISMPAHEVERVRAMLPQLFAGFVIDGVELGGEALDSLPQPLVFPTGPDDLSEPSVRTGG